MESKDEEEFPFKGEDKIEDSKERVKDSKLFSGTCIMDGCSVTIMIKKGIEIKKETYDLMKFFQHNTLIPHLNFYPESNQGRLVIPIVGASFETWFHEDGWKLLIKENGSMTPLFDTMIIDICDLVEKLYDKFILIKNLDQKNLYMAEEIAPRILLLVTEAEPLPKGIPKIAIWKPVQEIVEWCYKECKVKLNDHVQRYIDFIGTKHFNLKNLKSYPLNWDGYTKGEYMFSLIAANQNVIRFKMGPAGISWPIQDGKLPDLLNAIV